MFAFLKKKFSQCIDLMYKRLIQPIFELRDTPHSIALGTAIGVWIALTPTVGIQMALAVLCCFLLRANAIIAAAMCWISNPLTFVPMYYAYYWLGLVVINAPAVSVGEFAETVQNNYLVIAPAHKEVSLSSDYLKEKQLSFYYHESDVELERSLESWGRINNLPPAQTWTNALRLKKWEELIQKDYFVINWTRYNQIVKDNQELAAKYQVVQKIAPERNFWQKCSAILSMMLQEIAYPMWIGSLILATLCAIPSYFITLRAIRRYHYS